MSAFVMEQEFFNQLASEVYMRLAGSNSWKYYALQRFFKVNRNDLCEAMETKIRTVCQRLYDANIDAVNGRYSGGAAERHKTIEFGNRWQVMTDIQLYKHLSCLHYQMAEEPVCKTEFYKEFSEMKADFAESILGETAEYKTAKWSYERQTVKQSEIVPLF